MFKKFLSVLLLVLLVMSSVGSISARVDNYDCPIKLYYSFTKQDFYNSYYKSGLDHGFNLDSANEVLKESGLFIRTYNDGTRYGWNDIYKADKLGNYTLKCSAGQAFDPDYYHFRVIE